MASLGAIPFAGRLFPHDSAAAVKLSGPPPSSIVQELDDAEGEVRPDSNYIVVRFNGAFDATSARSKGLELAQRCLDLMSVLGKADLVTTNATEESFVSWRAAGEQRIQLLSTTTLSFDVPPANLVVRDPEGDVVEQKTPRAEYHPAFRYFRLSQVSDDLHEAFRNMYLAFELLLSSRHPPQMREREKDWLLRAVRATHEELDLGRFVRHSTVDVVDEFLARVYTDTRLPLFHAKMGRNVLTPQTSGQERSSVLKALELVTPIVLEMSRAWYCARRQGGGVFHAWVYQNLRSMYESARILAMDDPSPPQADQRNLNAARYNQAVEFRTEVREDPDVERAPMLWGEVRVDALWEGRLSKIEVVGENSPILAYSFSSPLTLDGFDVFEYCDRTAIRNVRQPRRFYER